MLRSFFSRPSSSSTSHHPLDLEEALEPPDLEDALGDEHADLDDTPPLDARVGALGRVAVHALAHDDVGLLVLDLGDDGAQGADWNGSSLVSCSDSDWRWEGEVVEGYRW